MPPGPPPPWAPPSTGGRCSTLVLKSSPWSRALGSSCVWALGSLQLVVREGNLGSAATHNFRMGQGTLLAFAITMGRSSDQLPGGGSSLEGQSKREWGSEFP